MKEIFFSLLKSVLFQIPLNEEIKNLITDKNILSLLKMSRQHDLAHLIGDALDKNGLLPEGSEERRLFIQERTIAICRYEQIQYELDRIYEVFEKIKIKFIPLKGAKIREYYPEPWMRTSCDIDILVHEEDLKVAIEALKSQLSYKEGTIGKYDANMFSESGVHLELRYNPSSVSSKSKKVLSSIWANVVDEKENKLTLTNEMFYFYHIEHMAGHFIIGGCGIRFFLDAYILNKELGFNQELKQKLLRDAGLETFANGVEKLAEFWFANGEKSQLVQGIEEYVLYSGIYGRMENRVAIGQIKKSKIRFILSRIFLPYKELRYSYPKLQKYPVLYPFYVVKRWFKLLKKDSRKKSKKEFLTVAKGGTNKKENIEKMMKNLDLNITKE
jgi:hypothetical protein